jgi:hypothetical protein
VRNAQALRERPGNQGGLMVSAPSLALAVERHGHNNIGCEPVALAA